MPILLDLSLECNFKCKYCYNQELRKNNEKLKLCYVDLNDIVEKLEFIRNCTKVSEVVLHGGEPLYWNRDKVDNLLSILASRGFHFNIQTNGFYLDQSIDLIKKYNIGVGISIDGYGNCNKFRADLKTTNKILKNIDLALENKINVSIISVIHKANGLKDTRDLMKQFILDMSNKGINGRLNPCLIEDKEIMLTVEELTDFYTDMLDYMIENGIYGWSPFKDMQNAMLGKSEVVCVFTGCDPYRTVAGTALSGSGLITVCHKFHKELILNDLKFHSTRLTILRSTDCKDCKYWAWCYGGCPADSINNDWRNKSRWCEVYKALFRKYENLYKHLGMKLDYNDKRYGSCEDNKCTNAIEGHTDGIKHTDGEILHLDSDMR